jgi:signal transduction histidine kinase/ActR/RegA family two-component response regulator
MQGKAKVRLKTMARKSYTGHFMWSIVALGAAITLFSAARFSPSLVDLRFLVLSFITIFVSSRLGIKIPHVNTSISVSDTFIFITMMLYGGEAAVLLAAVEGACSTMRVGKKPVTILFNAAVMACSTFCSALAVKFFFGEVNTLQGHGFTSIFISALGLMALVQYTVNSGLVAVGMAYKSDQPVWFIWKTYYLWSSISYFAGAAAAGTTVRMMHGKGFYAVITAVPIIAIVYFTYRTYLRSIEASEAQAEQAQRHVEELSRYIAEQERLREQFSQLEKLSALGELASGVAHDFNNMLAGILGRAQLLQRTNNPDKIKKGLEIIIKAAEDGAHTVKRIQDFARQRRDHDFEPIAVEQLLRDASEITRPRWKDQAEANSVPISLELDIRSDATVMGDISELREVLVNMIFNSVDAMQQGGQLKLSAENDEDGFVKISISDTGSGINPEVRPRIFDPFFTTKGKAGLGMGLAVSYGIIRRHEGEVEVDSEIGRGTTFSIKLPVFDGQAEDISDAAELWVAPVSSNIERTKILVVEDEAPVRELLRDILETEGCQVVMAADGKEALTLFDAESFDAVFTDIGMPGMSGWELARAIRERQKQIPLAVITGWGEAVSVEEKSAAQVNWVVSKPFAFRRIIEILGEISEQQRGRDVRKSLTIAAA